MTILANILAVATSFPAPVITANKFTPSFALASVANFPPPAVSPFGPFTFGGSEGTEENFFAGSVVYPGYGGTEVDANTYGGTEADTNPYLGAGVTGYGGIATVVAGYGGTFTETNEYGGSSTETNEYGGAIIDEGCLVDLTPMNLTLGEYNDETIYLTITNHSSPFTLTGYGINVYLKTAAGVSDSAASTIKLSSIGVSPAITVTNSSAGQATLVIPRSDLTLVNNINFWRCDVADGDLQATAAYGSVVLRKL